MAITIAAPSDFEGIREIWRERFTTDEKYLEVMFKRIMPLCTSYIYKNEKGEILSAASFMPMKFIDSSRNITLQGWYMFGVATLVKATGKRLAAGIISYATDDISTKNYHFIFERPANQSLNNFYLKLGFTKALKKLPIDFSAAENECSPRNTTSFKCPKTLSEHIIKGIDSKYEKKFIWENSPILKGLIELGELDEHQKGYSSESKEEVYIAINHLNGTPPNTFDNTFFCFPME